MSCENCEESAYVIDKLAKLLAEIAVIVNGPEPPLTSWSYHDLPEKVRALKQAPPAAVPAEVVREFLDARKAFKAASYTSFGEHHFPGSDGNDAHPVAVRLLAAESALDRAMLAAAQEATHAP